MNLDAWAIGVVVVLAAWLGLHWLGRGSGPTAVVAHRGAAGEAPENTLAAVRRGMESGAAFLEVDLRQTSDGVFVLLHDRDLDRTSDAEGPIDKKAAADVVGLDVGSWYSGEFTGEGLPTLTDLLHLTQAWPGTLVLELKDPGLRPSSAAALAEALAQASTPSRILVSFDHGWLRSTAMVLPDQARGELSLYPLRLPSAGVAQLIGVHWLATLLDPTLIWRTHRRRLALWVWTTDSPSLIRWLAWKGVDAITTNSPSQAQHILALRTR